MYRSLAEIKQLRKKFSLSQSQLAKLAGVSQSLVAKIEAGRIDPTYTKTQSLFGALDSLLHQHDKKASDVMSRKVISLAPSESVKDAIKMMKRHEISQLPVIGPSGVVGMVSEGVLLDALLEKDSSCRVEEIMEDVPPVISSDTSVRLISDMLHHFPFILVAKKGEVCGVITKADVLSLLA